MPPQRRRGGGSHDEIFSSSFRRDSGHGFGHHESANRGTAEAAHASSGDQLCAKALPRDPSFAGTGKRGEGERWTREGKLLARGQYALAKQSGNAEQYFWPPAAAIRGAFDFWTGAAHGGQHRCMGKRGRRARVL